MFKHDVLLQLCLESVAAQIEHTINARRANMVIGKIDADTLIADARSRRVKRIIGGCEPIDGPGRDRG